MPASLRAHMSRATSSRPYDRRSSHTNIKLEADADDDIKPNKDANDQDESEEGDEDEGVPPADRPGLPTYADYKRIEADYLHGLSPRKRDKALITQVMFDKIWDVLHQPNTCTIETPQFRFWVRKMFTLARPTVVGGGVDGGSRRVEWISGALNSRAYAEPDSDDDNDDDDKDGLELECTMGIRADDDNDNDEELVVTAVVLHENRPVAIREQLYELFCYCHVRAGHGGRDKTCAVIRQHYSWVPKELTAQFVKACPTCSLKRSGHGVNLGMGNRRRAKGRAAGGQSKVVEEPPRARSVAAAAVGPSSMGHRDEVWQPTTGGPLDPTNPLPCGLRERAEQQREHEQGLLRSAHEETKTVCQSSQSKSLPVGNAMAWSVQMKQAIPESQWSSNNGWAHHHGMTQTHGTSPKPFSVQLVELESKTRRVDPSLQDFGTRSSPAKNLPELPSLASALSDESLDDHVNLTLSGLGQERRHGNAGGAGDCHLPPALRPLRLSRPVPIATVNTNTEPSTDRCPPLTPSRSVSGSVYFFPPLSFDYPGLSAVLVPGGLVEADNVPSGDATSGALSGFKLGSCPDAMMPLSVMNTGMGMLPSEDTFDLDDDVRSMHQMPELARDRLGYRTEPDSPSDLMSLDGRWARTMSMSMMTSYPDYSSYSPEMRVGTRWTNRYARVGVSGSPTTTTMSPRSSPLSSFSTIWTTDNKDGSAPNLTRTGRYAAAAGGSRHVAGYRDHVGHNGALAMLLPCSATSDVETVQPDLTLDEPFSFTMV